jgi:hypothetical protein
MILALTLGKRANCESAWNFDPHRVRYNPLIERRFPQNRWGRDCARPWTKTAPPTAKR